MSKIDKLIAKHCPKGVRFFELGEVCDLMNGYAFNSKEFNEVSASEPSNGKKGKPIIRIRNIKKNRTNTIYLGKYSDDYVVANGDLLIGMDGEFNACIWQGGEALLNQRVCKLVPSEKILSYFLFNVILKPLKKIEDNTYGTTVKHISSGQIKTIKIPVPPVAVQKEIVKILDSYTECEAELKAQLEAEITAREQEYSYHRNALLGFDPSAIKNHPLKNLINKHCPKGVPFFELGEVCEVNSKSDDPKNLFKDEFIYIDISSVESKTGKIDLTHKLSLKKYPSRARRVFKKGDILMSSVRPNLQSFAYVDFDVTNHIASTGFLVLSPDIKLLNSKFLYRMLFSENMQSQMILKMGKGGYPSINQKDAFQLKIPVPPVAVQKEIVRILDSYTECEAELKAQLEAEITARRSQYEYCRNKLLTFEESYGV